MKKLSVPFLFLFISLPFVLLSQQKPIEELIRDFHSPTNEFRGKPFWSWNDKLEEEELIRQIYVMKEMGMGGFFMHSRVGLDTEYLGEEWFRLINLCADKAEELGMEAWLYDEDRWPSGLAGGLVTKHPEYRQQQLALHTFKPSEFDDSIDYFALFACRLEGVDCYDYRKIEKEDISGLDPSLTVLAFFQREREAHSFYNGYTDVDRMSREATDYFIEVTHERYRKYSGDRLGRSIFGIFTDEPHRGAVMSTFGSRITDPRDQVFTAWTTRFPEEFEKRMGYDIMERLPEIFYRPNGEAVSQVKWHYMEVAQQLFIDNWVIPNYEWCDQNNQIFTGHYLHEDNLTAQVAMQGSLMRGYEYMHYPGIDILTEGNRNYWVAKQAQSVARQMGQDFILSELYGVTGWQFDFFDHKWVGDWQTLFGINLRCHHLSWYSMKGERKRDYPASILHQSGWYPEYDYVETYFSRFGYLMSQGNPVCDVLVLNPIESVWAQVRIGWANGLAPADPEVIRLEQHYAAMFNALQGHQIDFDYADEDMFARHGSVVVENGVPFMKVGQMKYRTVVLGRMTTIRSTSLQLLNEFSRAGGKVIIAGEAPPYVDALLSDQAKAMAAANIQIPFSAKEIVQAVQSVTPVRTEAIDMQTGEPVNDIFCQVKQDGDRTIFMALNINRNRSYDQVKLRVKATGEVTEWDSEHGDLWVTQALREGEYMEIIASFERGQERIYTLTPQAVPGAKNRPVETFLREIDINGPFDYTLNEPNICVLDIGYLQIQGQETTALMEILQIDRKIRDHFSLDYRGNQMIQPWFSRKFFDAPQPLGNVRITFPFYVDRLPADDLQLVMETPERFTVFVNGQPLALQGDDWWVDQAFRISELPVEMLKTGQNVLVMETNFQEDTDIEAVYLLGDFSVRLEGNKKILGHLPNKISVGDLTLQGLPFYTGRVTYVVPVHETLAAGEIAKIVTPEFHAACVKLIDGDGQDRIIAWPPFTTEATNTLVSDRNLELEVILTRRNAFGPFHFVPFTGTTGPNHFVPGPATFTMDYMLYPSGLIQAPKLRVYKTGY